MLKRLDVYIIKKFLGTFFFSIILIIGIAIIFDISEKIDDFIEKEAPLGAIAFDYYLNFIPYYSNLFSFLFIFIAVIFFTSKMASNSEIIAILASGVSYNRLMRPYFISALIIAIFSFVMSNWIIPPANKVRLAFEDTYINNTYRFTDRNFHKQIQPGVFVYIDSYNNRDNEGTQFSMETITEGKLQNKLMAEKIRWDSISNKWQLSTYRIRFFEEKGERIVEGQFMDTVIAMYPEDFRRKITIVETMNLGELNEFIERERMSGSGKLEVYLIEKYKRTSFAFSSFILTLIGVSLSSRKTRGGTGFNLGVGLLLSFTYILFMQVSFQFSIGSNLSPLIAVWIPNFIYAFIAFFLYRIAPK